MSESSTKSLDAALAIAGVPIPKAAEAVLSALEERAFLLVEPEVRADGKRQYVFFGKRDAPPEVAVLFGKIADEHWTILQKTKRNNVYMTLARVADGEEFKFSEQVARAWALARRGA